MHLITSNLPKTVCLLGTECAAINLECAKIAQAQKDDRAAAGYRSEAAEFLAKSGQKDESARVFKETADNFKRSGNFDQAGSVFKKLGEYYEEQVEPEVAINYYLQAVDMFSLAKFKTTEATKLKVKIADLYAEMTDKPDKLAAAVKAYEEVAFEYLNNNLMRFNAKNLLVKAVLVFLLMDVS